MPTRHIPGVVLALAALFAGGCTADGPSAPPPGAAPSAPSAPVPAGTTAPGPGKGRPDGGRERVSPTAETDAFPGRGDIADDAAIWVDPRDPGRSVVIGGDKSSGIGVFDLTGRMLHYRRDGRIGNVDVRDGFPLGGRRIALVAANNRSDDTLAFYDLDPATRQLRPVPARRVDTVSPNYGFCLYHSRSGKFYAFVTQARAGRLEQWRLSDDGGTLSARMVRSFDVGSQSEGCVADDALGHLYVAEENVGIWKYAAEPDSGSNRTAVDSVGRGRLARDVEGLTLARGPGDTGYLLASSQGNSTLAVYERAGSNAFVKAVSVGGRGTIDGVSDTDGISATSSPIGPLFPRGLLVVHDAKNSGAASSNFKYVRLDAVVDLPPPVGPG